MLPRVVEEIVSRGEVLSLHVQRLGAEALVVAVTRVSNKDVRELAEHLRALGGVESVDAIAEEVRGLWFWSGGGPPMIGGEEMILLRREQYIHLQEEAFDRLESVWEGIIDRQMRRYGAEIARWYRNNVRGVVEDMVRAATLLFKLLGLGSVAYIRTWHDSYVIEVESWVDPPGRACPSAKRLWQGFLSELVGAVLMARSDEIGYGEGPICRVTLYP
ncbi:MAG: hypothetical protein DRO39_02700 [Thermoprotei archaeon]|nr:MAG: hypothetical protein DRO39_02700 [Thermoprotei archaeon]